jgi:uncharacterized protein YceH (UPF0502 family)
MIDDLSPTQTRILGALLEKEQATPEYYPLTVNALLAACNQKSNRDPVMSLTEGELWDELEGLRAEVLVWRSEGARAQRWSQSISRRLELDVEEKAVLTLLMLRGPQTVGELRSRSQRLHTFDSLAEVESALRRMATEERDLVREMQRQPGQKENRWMQLLGEESSLQSSSPVPSAETASPAPVSRRVAPAVDPDLQDRVVRLEKQVEALEASLERLLGELGS